MGHFPKRDLAFRRAEERQEEVADAEYQQRRIIEDEVIEAERLIYERGYAVYGTDGGPVSCKTLDCFIAIRDGASPALFPGLCAPYVAPPDPKPVFAPRLPRPPGPPRGPRNEPRR